MRISKSEMAWRVDLFFRKPYCWGDKMLLDSRKKIKRLFRIFYWPEVYGKRRVFIWFQNGDNIACFQEDGKIPEESISLKRFNIKFLIFPQIFFRIFFFFQNFLFLPILTEPVFNETDIVGVSVKLRYFLRQDVGQGLEGDHRLRLLLDGRLDDGRKYRIPRRLGHILQRIHKIQSHAIRVRFANVVSKFLQRENENKFLKF